jgi:DNA polymerase (family X)
VATSRLALSDAFSELAALLQLSGANVFKVRAYERAARTIDGLPDDLEKLVREKRLTEIDGIGEAIGLKIEEFLSTGKIEVLEKLRAQFPQGVMDLWRLPGLGPKKLKALLDLGIQDRAMLRAACLDGRVRGLPGFGEKTEKRLLELLDAKVPTPREQTLLVEALREAAALLDHLRQSKAVLRAEAAGSLRRRKETVSDLDVVVASAEPAAVMAHFAGYSGAERVESAGSTKSSLRLSSGLQLDLRVLPEADFATALHHFTGSKAHHERLRGLARDKGFTLSEWGLFRLEGAQAGSKVPIASEAEIYAALGLPFIPPELREDHGEIEAALAGDRFEDLIAEGDLRGGCHAHTVASDGRASLQEMAWAAEALGLRYLTITDHSPSSVIAHGLSVDRLKAQGEEIARVQEGVSVKLLRGSEVDILREGALDHPDAVLEQLDVIIASVHQRHQLDEDAATKRFVAAMRHPLFKVWGHPLGRRLLEREPVACRVEEVLDAAAESRVAIEINGDPHRLDLAPRWIREARKRKLRFVISSDAHSVEALINAARFGVPIARRGGVRRHEVLNALGTEEFVKAVKPGG